MQGFKKRHYTSFRHFISDITHLIKNKNQIKGLMKGQIIPAQFRERLMLAVTAVNGCRYCSHFHAKEALLVGLSYEEMQLLLSGTVDNCPPDEAPALLFAQHWAENNGNSDPQLVEKMIDTYTKEVFEAIEMVLRMIRFGNLSGNTLDYFIYRLTFGLRGV